MIHAKEQRKTRRTPKLILGSATTPPWPITSKIMVRADPHALVESGRELADRPGLACRFGVSCVVVDILVHVFYRQIRHVDRVALEDPRGPRRLRLRLFDVDDFGKVIERERDKIDARVARHNEKMSTEQEAARLRRERDRAERGAGGPTAPSQRSQRPMTTPQPRVGPILVPQRRGGRRPQPEVIVARRARP